jgi:hypothetical protein
MCDVLSCFYKEPAYENICPWYKQQRQELEFIGELKGRNAVTSKLIDAVRGSFLCS